jgi:hypothetical protein
MGCEERERVRLDGLVVLVGLPGDFKRTDRELRVLARGIMERSRYLNHVWYGRGRGITRRGTVVRVLVLEYQSRGDFGMGEEGERKRAVGFEL